MNQIAINTVSGVCPTLLASAFAKGRVSYFLGQGKVWRYPAILMIYDKADSNKSNKRRKLHDKGE